MIYLLAIHRRYYYSCNLIRVCDSHAIFVYTRRCYAITFHITFYLQRFWLYVERPVWNAYSRTTNAYRCFPKKGKKHEEYCRFVWNRKCRRTDIWCMLNMITLHAPRFVIIHKSLPEVLPSSTNYILHLHRFYPATADGIQQKTNGSIRFKVHYLSLRWRLSVFQPLALCVCVCVFIVCSRDGRLPAAIGMWVVTQMFYIYYPVTRCYYRAISICIILLTHLFLCSQLSAVYVWCFCMVACNNINRIRTNILHQMFTLTHTLAQHSQYPVMGVFTQKHAAFGPFERTHLLRKQWRK